MKSAFKSRLQWPKYILAIITFLIMSIGWHSAMASSAAVQKPRPKALLKILDNADFVAVVTLTDGKLLNVEGSKHQQYYIYQFKLENLIKGKPKTTTFCTGMPLEIGVQYLLLNVPERWKRHYPHSRAPNDCGSNTPYFEALFSEEVIKFALFAGLATETPWLKLVGGIYKVPASVRRYTVKVKAKPEVKTLKPKIFNMYELVSWQDIRSRITQPTK